MGGSLVSLAAGQAGMFEGNDLVNKTLRDATARPEVERVLAVSKARAKALVDANRHILHALRDALLDRDELIGDEITDVARAAGEPVTEVQVERRGTGRRRHDHLADERARNGELTVPYADFQVTD